jgi:hypothetical protein
MRHEGEERDSPLLFDELLCSESEQRAVGSLPAVMSGRVTIDRFFGLSCQMRALSLLLDLKP